MQITLHIDIAVNLDFDAFVNLSKLERQSNQLFVSVCTKNAVKHVALVISEPSQIRSRVVLLAMQA